MLKDSQWSKKDIARLEAMFNWCWSKAQMAKALKRSYNAIAVRLKRYPPQYREFYYNKIEEEVMSGAGTN